MAAELPDETLRAALRRLGEQGIRAEQFLESSAVQLNSDQPLAAEHAAYALREALMAIVHLGGRRPRGVREGASEVVRQWRMRREADVSAERIEESIHHLADLLDRPGPNERMLESAVSELARIAPTRTTADLLDQFIRALDEASISLHSASDLGAVEALYARACVVLRDLFGPISVRFAAMDDLVDQRDPGPAEVGLLRQRLGDERHLIYLYDRATGPGWFRALRDDPLLIPPDEGPWSAGPYIDRVAETHPDEVRAWLSDLSTADLTTRQVGNLLRIARRVSGDVAEIALRLARGHLDSPHVQFQVDALLREIPKASRVGQPVRSLIRQSLMQTLGERSGSMDAYMASEQLKMAVEAITEGDPDEWLVMLAHRARDIAESVEPLRLRVLAPLDELHLDAGRVPLELVAAALLQAANASAEAGLSIEQRLSRLRLVPEPLADRLIAQHLTDQLPASLGESVAFVSSQVASKDWPSAEELALLRRVFVEVSSELVRGVTPGLGPPPTAKEIQVQASAGGLSDAIVRAHRWLVAIPEPVAPTWHAADAEISAHIGFASQDGVMMRRPDRFVGQATPITLEELATLTPRDAAARVAAWRPAPDRAFFGPSAEGLAGTLRRAMDADMDRWIAAGPVKLATALQQPMYITVWLQALEANAARLAHVADEIVTLTELVRSEPRSAEDLEGDALAPRNSWAYLAEQAIKLLGQLGRFGALRGEVDDRAWAQVVGAVRQRSGISGPIEDQTRGPLDAAVVRPSMRALEAAVAIGGGSTPTPEPRLLALFEELLALDGIDGLHSRAMLAPQLNWLRSGAPAWFAEHEPLLFGGAAPNDLGQATFDLYLEWGSPYKPMLQEQRPRIIAALAGSRHEEATQHLLQGLLWKLQGYEAGTVADILVEAGSQRVYYAGRWLGWGLAHADESVDQGPVVALWRDLLNRRLAREAYAGFGWMAVNDHLDSDTWLELTHDTAVATAGVLDEPDRVAQRAGQTPSDPRTAQILSQLLADDPASWDMQRIGEIGLEVLQLANGSPAAELRERLLERGFHAAIEI
ncbi:MAG: hypothetical protein ACXVHQ_36245 [Solirubrobacteraceae bacterium]